MSNTPYDPRAVANLLLDIADNRQDGRPSISNLALQKLLYFAHGLFLIRTRHPLVQGGFEAWKYGPVHPAVYQAFKSEGDRPIKIRAYARNVITGETKPLSAPSDPMARQCLDEIITGYGHLSPGQLVDISHAPRGPWATIVNKARIDVALGMRIPDSVTVECFKYQKVSVGSGSRIGEPDVDSPLVGD